MEEGDWHARFLGAVEPTEDTLLASLLFGDTSAQQSSGDIFAVLARQEATLFERIAHDIDRFTSVRGTQAYCLECPSLPGAYRTTNRGGKTQNNPTFWELALGRLIAQ